MRILQFDFFHFLFRSKNSTIKPITIIMVKIKRHILKYLINGKDASSFSKTVEIPINNINGINNLFAIFFSKFGILSCPLRCYLY